MKDKAPVMEQRSHNTMSSWFLMPQELEDDFLSGKTPVYLEDTWEEE